MDLKFLNIFSLATFVLTVSADLRWTDHFENVARLAFEKHYPNYTFGKLIHQYVDSEKNLVDFIVSSTRTISPENGSGPFLCSLVVELNSVDRVNSSPSVLSGTCNSESSHAEGRQNGAVRDIHSIYNVTEEEMGLVHELADFAAKKLDEIDADNRKNLVEKVLNPTKQFAGGILYEFTLKLIETNCPEHEEDNEACRHSTVEPVKLCNIKVLRTWALKNVPHATLVESHCQPEYETLYGGERKPKSFDSISTLAEENPSTRHSKKRLLGGPLEADPNDEKVVKYAKEALAALDERSESKYKLGLIRVVNAKVLPSTEGMVHGLFYFLKLEAGSSKCLKNGDKEKCFEQISEPKICNVQVWLQEGAGKSSLRDSSCEGESTPGQRRKRSPEPLVGGPMKQPLSDADILKYAKFSLSALEEVSGLKSKLKLVEVLEASTQVVSGTLYTLKMRVANSKADSRICNVKVWVQPWLKSEKVTDASCENKPLSRRKRELVGGTSPLDVNDAEVKKYAKLSFSTIASQPGNKDALKLDKILEAERQSVSGFLYHLKFQISNAKGESKTCTAKVWVQAWLHKEEVTEATCENKPSSRRKRSPLASLPGAVLKPMNVNDALVQKYANFSMSTLEGLHGSKEKLKLVEVLEAFTQNEAINGVVYHLKLKVADYKEDSSNKICNAKVKVYWAGGSPETEAASCEETAARRKRSLGGTSPVDVSDPEVLKCAQLSVSTLASQSGANDELKLVEIVEAKRAIVAGFRYDLTFKISDSKGDSKTCTSKVWVQPWLDSRKVTEASCEDKPLSRSKRSPERGEDESEGPNDSEKEWKLQPPDSADVQKYAKHSLPALESSFGAKDKLKLVEVVEAATQDVSGKVYRFVLRVADSREDPKVCHVKVGVYWGGGNPDVYGASCEHHPTVRDRRSAHEPGKPILGGQNPVDVGDAHVQKLAKFSLSSLESASGTNEKLQLVEVIEAKKQIVAGMQHHLKLKVSNLKGESKICNVKVLEQLWISSEPKVTEASCENKPLSRRRRSPTHQSARKHNGLKLGGLEPIDVNDPDVQKYANYAIETIESSPGSGDHVRIVNIVKASQQVVSGWMYHLRLEVADSKTESKFCNVKIWVQPWISEKPKQVLATCEDKPLIERKLLSDPSCGGKECSGGLLGGLRAIDVDNEEVQNYAQLSLPAVERLPTTRGHVQLIKVLEAYEQMVKGKVYHLKLIVSDSEHNFKHCQVRVSEQLDNPLDPRKIEAFCKDEDSSRKKRPLQNWAGIVSPVDVNDDAVQHYAYFSLPTIANLPGSGDNVRLIEVIKAHRQVVAGWLYTLKMRVADSKTDSKICNVKVWVQHSVTDDIKEVDASCEDTPTVRSKRAIDFGTLKHMDVYDDEVQKYAMFSLASVGPFFGQEKEQLKLMEVVDAYAQKVVSGMLYYLKLRVGTSEDDFKYCNTKVWVKPKLHSKEVTDAQCREKPSFREKRSPGPSKLQPVDLNEDIDANMHIMKYVTVFLAQFRGTLSSTSKLKLLKVIEAYQEVPDDSSSGSVYSIKVHVADDCSGHEGCSENGKICKVRVLAKESQAPKIETVECVLTKRRKRSIVLPANLQPKFTEEVKVDDLEVQEFAKFSLRTLENLSESNEPFELVDIMEARKQAADGYIYDLKLRVGNSTGTKICNAKVLVPLTSKNMRVLEAVCEDTLCQGRDKRSHNMLVCGRVAVDVNEPRIQKYARNSVAALEGLIGGPYELVRVVDARIEVDSGLLYSLTLDLAPMKCMDKDCVKDAKVCYVKLLVEELTKSEKIVDAACKDRDGNQFKRSTNLNSKEKQKVKLDDEKLREYANFAVAEMEAASGSSRKLALKRIIDAKVRMVSGRMYILKLEVGYPNLNCSNPANESECGEEIVDPKICNVKIWVQDWLSSTRLTDATCDGISLLEREKRSPGICAGCPEQKSVNDPNVLKYAQLSLAKLDGLSQSDYKLGLNRVVDAKVQVVSGSSYTLKMEVGTSKCQKSDPSPKHDCSADLTDTKICTVKVWVQDWLNKTEISNASCEDTPNENVRKTRSNLDYADEIPGEMDDETKPNYSEFLESSLEESYFGKQRSKEASGYIQISRFTTESPRIPLEDNETQQYLNLTMMTLDDLTSSPFKLGLIKLLDLKKEEGPSNISVTLKLEVGYTKCPKSQDDSTPPVSCAKEVLEPRKCFVILTVLPEHQKIDVQSAMCDGIPDKIVNRKKRLAVGGRQALNIHSDAVERRSLALLPKLAHHFKAGSLLHLNRTVDARVEKVNGILYSFILDVIADEPCGPAGPVVGPVARLSCTDEQDAAHNKVHKYCLVKQLEKDWLKYSEVIFTKCLSNLNKLRKV